MASITKRPDGRWRARYRDSDGKEHARHFKRKVDGQAWLNEVTASVVRGDYVSPDHAKTTVRDWSAVWLTGYESRRPSTVATARSHVALINATFGDRALGQVKPSQVKAWTAKLKDDGFSTSYIQAAYARFSQLFTDAVHDGMVPRSPFSRRTSPEAPKQRPYVASTSQVWALYRVFPEHLRAAVLLGAFAGLRVGEVAGLRVSDVDFMRGVIHPAVQYPSAPLKTEKSRSPIPIPQELALELSRHASRWEGQAHIVTNAVGRQVSPNGIQTAMQRCRVEVEGLPKGFRFHDLRHYFASLLIAAGLDVKVVQERLRHESATTTLNTYTHLWPDSDESSKAAVAAAFGEGADSLRTKEA